jgi:hypothetical protein
VKYPALVRQKRKNVSMNNCSGVK